VTTRGQRGVTGTIPKVREKNYRGSRTVGRWGPRVPKGKQKDGTTKRNKEHIPWLINVAKSPEPLNIFPQKVKGGARETNFARTIRNLTTASACGEKDCQRGARMGQVFLGARSSSRLKDRGRETKSKAKGFKELMTQAG